MDWSIPKAELGYYIDEGYEGKGVVTKALLLSLIFVLLSSVSPSFISELMKAIQEASK